MNGSIIKVSQLISPWLLVLGTTEAFIREQKVKNEGKLYVFTETDAHGSMLGEKKIINV